jgi:hypothetical protein
MMKEAVAILMVVAGVVVAGRAGSRDDDPMALAVGDRIALDLPADIRLDAALMKLPLSCAGPAARAHRSPVHRRANRRACGPRVTATPDVARKISSDPTAWSRVAG